MIIFKNPDCEVKEGDKPQQMTGITGELNKAFAKEIITPGRREKRSPRKNKRKPSTAFEVEHIFKSKINMIKPNSILGSQWP